MISNKPIASLSLDLDNKWSYMKTSGYAGWETFPSYLDVAVPRILDFLKSLDLKVTFFIIGRDAAQEQNVDLLRAVAGAGHEIGNHSFHHEPWLHLYSEQQLDVEIASAEESIEQATGHRPIGFRGPGFSLSRATLQVLKRRGYLYDATTLPNFLNPLARAYLKAKSRLSRDEMKTRGAVFGSFRDGFRPITPYRWKLDGDGLLEIPVTTMPILRIPIHFSYVIFLGKFSESAALAYFRTAIRLCRLTGVQPSLLLHPLDFLGAAEAPELAFFPGMTVPKEKKMALVGETLEFLAGQFRVVTIQEHAGETLKLTKLREVEPRLQSSEVAGAPNSSPYFESRQP